MESSYHLSFGGLPTEGYTAGLPAGLSSTTCHENQRSPSLHSHDQFCPVDDGPVEVSNEGLHTCSTDI